jgi:hypothetical protein
MTTEATDKHRRGERQPKDKICIIQPESMQRAARASMKPAHGRVHARGAACRDDDLPNRVKPPKRSRAMRRATVDQATRRAI